MSVVFARPSLPTNLSLLEGQARSRVLTYYIRAHMNSTRFNICFLRIFNLLKADEEKTTSKPDEKTTGDSLELNKLHTKIVEPPATKPTKGMLTTCGTTCRLLLHLYTLFVC